MGSRSAFILAAVVGLVPFVGQSPASAQSPDAMELEARCQANAPTVEEVAICVNVVRRYLTIAPEASPPSVAGSPGAAPDGTTITVPGSHSVTLVDQQWAWESDNDFVAAAPGSMLVTVLVRFEGIDPAGSDYSPGLFKIFDQDGFEYDMDFIGREPALGFGDVRPGQKVQGWITFQVPALTSALSLAYSDSMFFSGESGRWELTR